MDDDIRVLEGSEFKMGMYRDLELLMSSVMGYDNELNDGVSASQQNENICELMDQGAICGPDGKRIPSKRGATPEARAEYLSTILMSGRPLFIYKKGEPYPRQVVYNPSTGRVEADAEPTMSMAPPQGPKPSALAMAWYRFRARNGHTPSQNFLEWQRYEDFGVASKNVSDKRRVRRRRRNDAILSSRYKNSGLNSGRNQNKHIAQTLISALKGPLGFGAELGAKGRNGLDELLTDGSIVNAYGQPICSKKPGSREAQYEAIGNWFTKSKQALYIYKPGEKYPHEVFLDSAGRVRISKDTIDKIPNENIKKPNFWQRMMDWFGQRNPAAFKYGRMLNRQAILRQAESAEWQRKRDELNKKHDLHPIRTEKTKEELKAAVEQKKQREAQNEQPTPEKQVEQPQKTIQQPTPEPKTQQPQQVQQPRQPQQTQPKPMTLEEQLAALQVQTKQMLERMSALEAQIRQQNQPVKTEAQPVKEEKKPGMEEAQPVAQQPKKGRELSIGSGGQVQLDAVEKKQPNADRELSIGNGENVQLNVAEGKPEVQEGAPKVRGEGDGIEFDPATGEYVRFDKFYMSAPEEWAERYRIRTGQEPSEAQMQAIYSLGDTPAGWTGIRQEMAEQQEKMKFQLESEQEAYERLQQPNADMELSIENGEDVQLNVPEDEPEIRQEAAEEEPEVKAEVAEVEAEELLEAPRERGEGDGIEYDPATGEYVHFDKFYMSAPEEWAERYRIRTGQEPSEAQMQAVYSLGDTPAGWSGIRQEMAEQQERMKYRLESEQEAYDRQQIGRNAQKEAVSAEQPKNEYVPISVAEPTRTNPVLEAPDQLIQRLNQEFPGRVTENMQKNIMAMHEKACDSYDTLEKACASQPKGENKGISGKEQVRDVLRYDYLSQSLNAGVMDEKDLVMLNSNSYQAIDNKIMDGASRSVGFYQNPQKPEVFRHGIMSRSGLDRVTDVYMQEKKGVLSNPELGNAGKFKSYVENYEKKALQQNEPARKRARTATKTDVKKMETHRRASVSGMGMH